MDNYKKIIKHYNLQRHPEGGYFAEIFRSDESISNNHLPDRYEGNRVFFTSIYFLLAKNDKSNFHILQSDELWYYHSGSSIILHIIDEQGNYTRQILGATKKSHKPSILINRNSWFAAENLDKESYGLVSCVVIPGFEFSDFTLGDRDFLFNKFPQHKKLIKRFTKNGQNTNL